MLYVIHCANNPELGYRGGQQPIIHLEADLAQVVQWAAANRRRWGFSLSNAGAFYTQFRASWHQLNEINWDAVLATDFRSADIKEGKQAEFLVETSFPWQLVERIGVYSHSVANQAWNVLQQTAHKPKIDVKRDWYY